MRPGGSVFSANQHLVPELGALGSNEGEPGRPAPLLSHIKTLQKFAAAHASIHNHFNQERHLYNRETFKLNRSAALAEWRQLAA